MLDENFTLKYRKIGTVTAFAIFFVGVIYAITLILGLLSLNSPQDPIGDPYFYILELLIVILAVLLVVCSAVIYGYAHREEKIYGLLSLVFMILMAGITTSVHFVILIIGRHRFEIDSSVFSLLFSFKYPSIPYGLDILAWDIFFALSMLFSAQVFRKDGLESLVRILMIVSGILSLAGLIGVPIENMQIRMIGVIGYAGVSPFAYFFLGIVFRRANSLEKSPSDYDKNRI